MYTADPLNALSIIDEMSESFEAVLSQMGDNPLYTAYQLIPRVIEGIDLVISHLRLMQEISNGAFAKEEMEVESDIEFFLAQKARFLSFQEEVAETYLGNGTTH